MEFVHVFMVGNESVCSWVSGGKLRSFFLCVSGGKWGSLFKCFWQKMNKF